MKKTSVAGFPGSPDQHTAAGSPASDPAPLLRPSSTRRLRNLRALVAEFSGRDIGCAGVALFLDCSLSAARNYVSELLDASVVALHPVRQAAGCIDRRLYKLTVDPLAVHAYLAALASSHGVEVGEWEAGRMERGWSAADFPLGAPPRRDPLVAALFGTVRPA